jgi:predicted aspartyl protease
MRVRISFSLAVIVVLFVRLDLFASTVAAPVPLTLTGSGQVLVPAMVNGSGPYLFVLDTGANRSAISQTLAGRLSLRPVAVSDVVTSSGSTQATVVRLQSISVGHHLAAAVLSPVLPDDQMRGVHKNADGIIGQDVLIDAHYTIDYRRRKLIWGDGGAGGAGTRLALRRHEGRVLVALPQSSSQRDIVWFVADSGASTLVLFQHDGRTGIPATALPARVRTTTVTGASDVQAAIIPKFRIGHDTWWDRPALLIGGADEQAGLGRPDGLLPLSWFSSVTFNGPENSVTVRR